METTATECNFFDADCGLKYLFYLWIVSSTRLSWTSDNICLQDSYYLVDPVAIEWNGHEATGEKGDMKCACNFDVTIHRHDAAHIDKIWGDFEKEKEAVMYQASAFLIKVLLTE